MGRNDTERTEESKRQTIGFDGNGGIFASENGNFQLIAENGQNIPLCDIPEINKDAAQLVTALLLQGEAVLQVVFGNETPLQQKLSERPGFRREKGFHLYSFKLTRPASCFLTLKMIW